MKYTILPAVGVLCVYALALSCWLIAGVSLYLFTARGGWPAALCGLASLGLAGSWTTDSVRITRWFVRRRQIVFVRGYNGNKQRW